MIKIFDELNDESFNTAAKALLVAKREIDASMIDWFMWLLNEVSIHWYDFNKRDREAEILEQWIALEDK